MSVTPAMGASTVAGRTATEPMRTSAGTRASAGIACSTGLSQFFFTVNPRRGISRHRCLFAPNKREPPPRRRPTRINSLPRPTCAAAIALSLLAYFRRNRSTRPAVSTSRCLPVKNGWQTEQIST